jgi:tripartite-type tricarboxylate transporter receptor subunit TctC
LALDFAKSEADRRALELIVSPNLFARPFAAPPGVPADRAQALRAAFDGTLADRAFIDEAKAAGLEVNPVSGLAIDRLIGELYQTPPDVVAQAKAAVAPER